VKILFLGDIVGRPGRHAIRDLLADVIAGNNIDLVLANGENAAGGFGISKAVAEELFSYGIAALTLGNHTWDNKSIIEIIDEEKRIIRPLNYNSDVPGRGWTLLKWKTHNIALINFIGQVFMNGNNSPFDIFDQYIEEIKKNVEIIIIDFHGEATGEKLAFAHYVDGKVSAVLGTHTHVQTSDNRILPKGTAYITDLGMCGACDSILGMEVESVIKRFKTQIPERYKIKNDGFYKLEGAIIEIDEETGSTQCINKIRIYNK
jgi:metallophosphoesterase (TIGR00282 family)